MFKGITKSGFKFEIQDSNLDNYELVELLAELDDNPLVFPKVARLILGDAVNELKEHVRLENGTVPVQAMMDEIKEILKSKPVKN